MVPLTALWLPVLVSAVFVFIASSVMYMVLPYHWNDYGPIPNEDRVMAVLREVGAAPGDYGVPHAPSPRAMNEPVHVAKLKQGPIAFITVAGPWQGSMTKQLAQWFAFLVLVSFVSGYVASRALGPGAAYGDAFRFAGTTAFAAYALGVLPQSIWYGRSWTSTLKTSFDGVVYALIIGGAFGWLWPS